MAEIFFNGPDGKLQGRYKEGPINGSPIALFLHPHPLFGGTMNNKILYHAFQSFSKRGFSCLRFNFRGVEKSEGEFSDGEGELGDAAAALDWLINKNDGTKNIWIVGYSFGTWIAMQLLMRRPEIAGFVCIAPLANVRIPKGGMKFDFSFLSPCPTNGLIIHGEKDQLVPLSNVDYFYDRISSQKNSNVSYEIIPNANHYFKNSENEIKENITEYLDSVKAPYLYKR